MEYRTVPFPFEPRHDFVYLFLGQETRLAFVLAGQRIAPRGREPAFEKTLGARRQPVSLHQPCNIEE